MYRVDSFDISKECRDVVSFNTQMRDLKTFLPLENVILKSKNKNDEDDSDPFDWQFYGRASSDRKDLEGDYIEPSAFGDCSYWLQHGYYNEDHKSGPEHILAVPLSAKVHSDGLYVSGYFLKSNPRSKYYYDLMKTFSKHNHMGRRVGLSIEGRELERSDDGRITKVWMKAIAICLSPVNTDAYAEIMTPAHNKKYFFKSIDDDKCLDSSSEFKTDLVKEGSSNIADKEVNSIESGVKKLDENKEADVDKALEAGYSTDQTNQTGGEALRVQSLDRNLKVETNDEESKCLDGTENKVNMTPLVKHAMEKALFSDPKDAEKLIDYARILVENGLI